MARKNVNLGLGCDYMKAAHDSGPRKLAPKYVIIHSTETPNRSGSARRIAEYFHRIDATASTQIVVDDFGCWRCVDDWTIPWAAPPMNSRGLHIEICGYAKWSRQEWFTHIASIERAAKATARWCLAYDIPVLWKTPYGLKNYRSGISSHANVSLAFGLSTHWDPGPEDGNHFPYKYFMERVKKFYDLGSV